MTNVVRMIDYINSKIEATTETAINAILEQGRALLDARAELSPEEFEILLANGSWSPPIEAQKLMALAEQASLSMADRTYLRELVAQIVAEIDASEQS